MSGKSGRLTFSGRNEYYIVPVKNITRGRTFETVGYAAVCTCVLGNHYLAPDGEHTAQEGIEPYRYRTPGEAHTAIEAWQRQQQQRQVASSESEVE